MLETNSVAGIEEAGYSYLCTTDMSQKLDDLFGFNYLKIQNKIWEQLRSEEIEPYQVSEPEIALAGDNILRVQSQPVLGLTDRVQLPVSREVEANILSARALMVAYSPSERAVDYFVGLAKKVGFFFALPYEEVVQSHQANLSVSVLERAADEGYVRFGETDRITGKPVRFVELTTKFCPVGKQAPVVDLGLTVNS